MLDEDPGFRQKIFEKIATDSIDWRKFVALCSNHLILPVIYLKFQSHGIIGSLPEELSEFLKEVYDLNLARNNQILEHLHTITGFLNKRNVYPVFLKGAGNLLDEVYKDVGERILGDIDLLVPDKDYLLTAKILEGEGYLFVMPQPVCMEVESRKHYPRIVKPGSLGVVEIHRLPVSAMHSSWFNYGIIDKEKKIVTALKGCFVLSDYHKIIHNFIHSQLDHGGHSSGIVSFRDLYDLYLFSKRVSIKQTLTGIKCKRKAVAYFAVAGKALGLDERFYSDSNFSSWLFLKRHDLNMCPGNFYSTYRGIKFVMHKIFIGYVGVIFKSIYSKNERQSLIHRLIDRNWYRAHSQQYRDLFRRDN